MFAVTVTVAPPLVVCDPAFVAEMPDNPGVLLKIGHFDEVGGVTREWYGKKHVVIFD